MIYHNHKTRPRDVRVATALPTAQSYDVSATVMAWRLVRITDEAIALAVLVDGRVQWAVRSAACPPLASDAGHPPAGPPRSRRCTGPSALRRTW